jgi:hypothetical protein
MKLKGKKKSWFVFLNISVKNVRLKNYIKILYGKIKQQHIQAALVIRGVSISWFDYLQTQKPRFTRENFWSKLA